MIEISLTWNHQGCGIVNDLVEMQYDHAFLTISEIRTLTTSRYWDNLLSFDDTSF